MYTNYERLTVSLLIERNRKFIFFIKYVVKELSLMLAVSVSVLHQLFSPWLVSMSKSFDEYIDRKVELESTNHYGNKKTYW